MKQVNWVALLALATLPASPGMAAGDFGSGSPAMERRSGAFAGLTVAMSLGAKRKPVAKARIQLALTQSYRAAGSSTPFRTHLQGAPLEIGVLGGKPTLFVGGHSLKSIERRAQLKGTESWLYVAGGLAAAGAAFLLLTDNATDAEPCVPGNC